MPSTLTFKPVTASTVGDFEALFGAKGGPNWCWCMAWRASSDEIKGAKGPQRREQILGRINKKVPVGILAYEAGEPVGWVSMAPKKTFRGLGGEADESGVWSITCLFVPRSRRGTGMANALIAGAIAYAKSARRVCWRPIRSIPIRRATGIWGSSPPSSGPALLRPVEKARDGM